MLSGNLPVVAIAGRPNVGKSTLFNRLVGKRVSIVDDRPGVTRDSIVLKTKLGGRPCHLVDTGGLTGDTRKHELDAKVEAQILRSIAGADLIVFVVDSAGGIVQDDLFVAGVLRKAGVRVLLAANKADSPERDRRHEADFFALGFGDPLPVSALNGRNLRELGELVVKHLPAAEEEESPEGITFCVVGRPNVGKSSLVNAILGQDRCVVSSVPGTTRDSIAADFVYGGDHFTIVDTAGQRRRKKNLDDVEFYSITRAQESIRNSDVAVLVIDATEGLSEGDKRIASTVLENRRGFLLVVNKMDLVDSEKSDEFIKYLANEAPFLRNTPVIFVSALERDGMEVILDNIADIHARMHTPLPLELLENVIYDVRALFSPRVKGRGAVGAISGVIHDRVNPPRVIIKVDDKDVFTQDYIRMIENRLREVFNLAGIPLEVAIYDTSPEKKAKIKKMIDEQKPAARIKAMKKKTEDRKSVKKEKNRAGKPEKGSRTAKPGKASVSKPGKSAKATARKSTKPSGPGRKKR